MDKMSLTSLLSVSTPEAILSLGIMLLWIDGKRYLRFNEWENVVRFILSVFGMVAMSFLIRWLAPNQVVSMVVQFVVYVLILKIVYLRDMPSKDVSKGVLIYTVILLAIELVFALSLIIFNEKGLNAVYGSDLKRFLYTIPERIVQILIFITSWKWHGIKDVMGKDRKVTYTGIYIFSVLILCEMGLVFLFSSSYGTMSLAQKIFLTVMLVFLSSLNVAFVFVMDKLSRAVFDECYKESEREKKKKK